jgi:type VII secretion-associated protein (TIGR03931 family)
VQYGYQARIPPGWAHTGGLPAERRSLLTPLGAPAGSDLVTVERAVVGYDTDAERDRARAEVRAAYDAAVAAGARLSGFDPDATLAGRPVTAYRQHGSAGRTVVDWFVVLDGDSQLDVGCQYTRANAAEVARACAVVVGSIRPTS